MVPHLFFSMLFAMASPLPPPLDGKAPAPAAPAAWLGSLPRQFQKKVLWCADHEEGSLHDWEYGDPGMGGGGVFNTGSPEEALAEAAPGPSFSGAYSARATIRNAFRSMNGAKAVRLMRWTDKPWDMGGKEFPRGAYYSVWMMIPENYNPNKEPPWDPGDGGWWNVFQFKSKDKDGESQPVWTLNITRDEASQKMRLHFYSKYNEPHGHGVAAGALPVGEWFHMEAYYFRSDRLKRNGTVALWVNGEKAFHARKVVTRLHGSATIWGIGNYTDHIDGGTEPGCATVYFDDAIVSKAPAHPYAKDHLASRRTGQDAGGARAGPPPVGTP